ncbi:MAG: glycosyltransferase family 39 protein [archaeon]
MVNKKWILLLILFVIVGIRLQYMDINSENYYWDEVVYLDLAKNINNGAYSSDIGEEFRAPLFPFVLSLFGYAHLLNFLLVIFGMILVYFLGKEIYNDSVGLISAIILGCVQLYFFYSFKVLSEPLTIIFLVGAMLFMYKDRFYFASILLGLAVLTRYIAGVFAVAFFLYLLYKKKWKELIVSGLIFALMLTPLFILGWINYGNPFGMLIENFFGQIHPHGGFFYYFIHIYTILGWFIPVMFVYGMFSKENKKPLYFFILLYFIVLMIISTKYERFFILIFPFIAIIAANGVYMLQKKYKLGLLFLAIWVIVSLVVGVVHIGMDRDNTTLLIHTAQELDLDGKVVATSPVYFSYFGDMDVYFVPEHEDYDVSDAKYYIFDSYHARNDSVYNYYTNYIKEEGKVIYNQTEGSRWVIVYEKD